MTRFHPICMPQHASQLLGMRTNLASVLGMDSPAMAPKKRIENPAPSILMTQYHQKRSNGLMVMPEMESFTASLICSAGYSRISLVKGNFPSL